MKMKSKFYYWTAWLLVLLLAAPPWVMAQGSTQETQESKVFKQEELDQMLAPIALYPDDLLTQILMASTYPLEIVQAARWTKQNKDLKGDKLTEALEKQDWDPSVKSLVNFPEVLEKMNENLEWTNKLGDAFLAQEKQVMDSIQNLRRKAEQAGNLQDTPQQKVIVEKETQTIVIQPAQPETIYVPSYSPATVYGAWPYPAYPPPPPFFPWVPGAMMYGAMSFGMGVAMGAAWGFAWGGANWGRGEVNINAARNTNINNNINREKYKNDMRNKGLGEGGQGKWKHDGSHRKGASYRDQGTANKFGKGSSRDAAKSREAFRGRADQGRQSLAQGGGGRGSSDRGGRGGQPTASQQGGRGTGGGAGQRASQQRAGGGGQSSVSQRGGRESAFGGSQRSGSEARQQSSRGSSSRQSMSSGGGRSSGGGSRGGGGGGGRGGGGGGGGRR